MKTVATVLLLVGTSLAWLLAAPLTATAAESLKTVGVVSVSGYDTVMNDLGLLAEVSGNRTALKAAQEKIQPLVDALDTTRPWGGLLRTDGTDFSFVAFVPVRDMDKLVALARERELPLEAVDNDYELTVRGGRKIRIRHQGGWAFVAEKEEHLTELPDDPAKLLGDLPKQYALAARINAQDIPRPLRQEALDSLQRITDQAGRQLPDESDEDYQIRLEYTRQQVREFQTLLEGIEQLTLGWSVDRRRKSTYLDVALTASPGTSLAKRMALYQDRTSAFGGFLLPDAALALHCSSEMTSEEIARTQAMLKIIQGRVQSGLRRSGALGDEKLRDQATATVDALMGAVRDTVASGRIDGGLVVLLKPRALTAVVGGNVAEGTKLDDAFRKFVALADQVDKDFPSVKFDAQKLGSVSVHTMEVPIDEGDPARKVFGEKLNVAVATGRQSWYVAMGSDPVATLGDVLEQGKKSKDSRLPPGQMVLSVGAVLRFMASVEEDNFALMGAAALVSTAKDKDHLRVVARGIPGGVRYRIEVEEGIVMILGQGFKLVRGFSQ